MFLFFMRILKDIRQHLVNGQFEFSRHAFRRAIERNISDVEIRQAGQDAQRIEDYPDDKYAPSCLLLGFTQSRRPLHIQVSHVESDFLKIITLYEPDPEEWYDFIKRR
ncbi:MAG: hypothetical protein NPIRA04_29630 [Nitrospirales bacterium]|nr:MAG: hypothetical protein NPIRA04_29630 [Nitrospirales bacterium]